MEITFTTDKVLTFKKNKINKLLTSIESLSAEINKKIEYEANQKRTNKKFIVVIVLSLLVILFLVLRSNL